jgi:transcriptional regulator with XRE-family HTH domain
MMQGSLAHKVRVLRAERGLTLREAASLTGVAKETISDIERGLRHPHDPTLAKIARGYDVPVEELLAEPIAAGKAEAPPSAEQPPLNGWQEERREYEERLGVALAILVEDCTEQGQEIEKHLRSLENAIPVSAYPFYEKLFALETIFEELAKGRQFPEELRKAKRRLDKIASRIDAHTDQLMHPSNVDRTRELFVERGIQGRRHEAEHQDVASGRQANTA